jgi:filamentous hemagglutinin family protein
MKWLIGLNWYFRLAAFITVNSFLLSVGQSVLSQVVPDSTLPTNSTVTPQGEINGGTTAGTNLFHSFSQFSIPTNGRAWFNNALNIQNIISRVTGSSLSSIDGLIRANGTANLFLINPNGIVLGPNAQLDIGGSFVGSTANAIQVGDQGFFSATNPTSPSLLTVNPSALVFNQTQSQRPKVTVQGDLRVRDGKSLLLVGGDINLNGADFNQNIGSLIALGGHVEIGAVAESGTVGLAIAGDNFDLNIPSGLALADVSITNGFDIYVTSGGSGRITINAQNINLANSSLQAGIDSELGSTDVEAKDININALGEITLTDSLIINNLSTRALGRAGDINITADSLFITGGQLQTITNGKGDAGNVNIIAHDTVSFNGTEIFARVGENAEGEAGDINIMSGSLEVNDVQLQNQTLGKGNAGDVNITARDTVTFRKSEIFNDVFSTAEGNGGDVNINASSKVTFDESAVFTRVSKEARGDAGNINITTGSLDVKNGAQLISAMDGQGDAGDLNINAHDTVTFDGSLVFNRLSEDAEGKGGDININTGYLSVKNGAQLQTITNGKGNAGDVYIYARDLVSIDGAVNEGLISSAIITSVGDNGIGEGGDINIWANQLTLSSNASLQSGVAFNGQGRGGDIILNITDVISLIGGSTAPTGESTRITIGVEPNAIGSSGDLNVKTGSFKLVDGAIVKTSTQGLGNAGNIFIEADIVDISGSVASSGLPSGLFSSTNTTGKAGNITVNSQTFRIADGAALSARSKGDGDGGDIRVKTSLFEALNGGQLVTTALGNGKAGNIFVEADQLKLSGKDPNYDARIDQLQNFLAGIDEFQRDLVANDITETGPASGLFAGTVEESTGSGGGIAVSSSSLDINDSAEISATSKGRGDAGDIAVDTGTLNLGTYGSISGEMGTQATGDGSRITITANDLTATSGGNITTTTSSTQGGSAGGIELYLSNRLTLSDANSGLFANAETGSTGNGGNIFVDPQTVSITNGAAIAVNSAGSGTGGSITLAASSLTLDNGAISAATTSSDGGNINLSVNDLTLLNNNSEISATAGELGNGGNLTIDTRFLIANNNSDITANAFQGTGGNIEITAEGIFLSSDSNITASSELGIDGTVQLNTLDVDPRQGLINLPGTVIDVSQLVSQRCATTRDLAQNQSEFIVAGRGGIPPSPTQPLQDDSALAEWITIKPSAAHSRSLSVPTAITSVPEPEEIIVEAQGWVVNDRGKIVLTAPASPAQPVRLEPSNVCQGS